MKSQILHVKLAFEKLVLNIFVNQTHPFSCQFTAEHDVVTASWEKGTLFQKQVQQLDTTNIYSYGPYFQFINWLSGNLLLMFWTQIVNCHLLQLEHS